MTTAPGITCRLASTLIPFPDPTEAQKARLPGFGEELDAHRKAQQAVHPWLTLTAIHNALEKLRAGRRIEGKDLENCDQDLIGILRDLLAQIDAAVAQAFGWPICPTTKSCAAWWT